MLQKTGSYHFRWVESDVPYLNGTDTRVLLNFLFRDATMDEGVDSVDGHAAQQAFDQADLDAVVKAEAAGEPAAVGTIRNGENKSDADVSDSKEGCRHYRRWCQMQARCCHSFYTCRRCHDEDISKVCEVDMDRHAVQTVKCLRCSTIQEVSHVH